MLRENCGAPGGLEALLVYRWGDVEVRVKLIEAPEGGGAAVFRKILCPVGPVAMLMDLDRTDLQHIPLNVMDSWVVGAGLPLEGSVSVEAVVVERGRLGRRVIASKTITVADFQALSGSAEF